MSGSIREESYLLSTNNKGIPVKDASYYDSIKESIRFENTLKNTKERDDCNTTNKESIHFDKSIINKTSPKKDDEI